MLVFPCGRKENNKKIMAREVHLALWVSGCLLLPEESPVACLKTTKRPAGKSLAIGMWLELFSPNQGTVEIYEVFGN